MNPPEKKKRTFLADLVVALILALLFCVFLFFYKMNQKQIEPVKTQKAHWNATLSNGTKVVDCEVVDREYGIDLECPDAMYLNVQNVKVEEPANLKLDPASFKTIKEKAK